MKNEDSFNKAKEPKVKKKLEENSNLKRRSTKKSVYIKLGEFKKEIKIEEVYNFNNFEFIYVNKEKQIIGSGTFGEVYLAKNKKNGNYYAIKQVNKERVIEQGAEIDIVLREIDVHLRIIHEHIVRMYSYHEDEESFYIVPLLLCR